MAEPHAAGTADNAGTAGPRVGLVVNPIAGLGGRVGLKGTDGEATVARALARGAVPESSVRAAAALRQLFVAWPTGRAAPHVLVPDGEMGAVAAREAGVDHRVVGQLPGPGPTSAADTSRLARALVDAGIDLLLVAGGDGTARDICAAVGENIPVLGIPAGVKILSGVFATSPAAAGELAASFLAVRGGATVEGEVVDLDEDAYRLGIVAPRLFGHLRVPRGRRLQGRKSPSPPAAGAAAAAIAEDVVERMTTGRAWILGPGSTVRAIADRLGVPKTLVGVDVVEIGDVGPRVVVADAAEADLLRVVRAGPATIVLTPIGGQGFLLGRGNQPISAAVLRVAGPDAILVVATAEKLAALGGRALLVDTGDPALDAALAGHARVMTGDHEAAIVRIAAA
jgi:predicted polyphosphate/ATP-dependent NAD kinase